MKTKTSQLTHTKQRLNKKPLLKRAKTNNKRWRVKSLNLNICNVYLIQIKFRTFTTPQHKRSKRFKQYVVQRQIFKVKETAISIKSLRQTNKKHAKKQLKAARVYSNIFVVAGIFGVLFFGVQVAGFGRKNPPAVNALPQSAENYTVTVPQEKTEQYLTKSNPTNITIPSVGINAVIQNVGLLADGTLETPDVLSNQVGWYKYSPTPGELGPSVLVGHVDSYKGPSVFWNLSKVNINDKVIITRQDGSIATFSVTGVEQYDRNNFLTDKVYGNIDHAGLRIITCGGTFSQFTGHYSQNTVVFAKLDQ